MRVPVQWMLVISLVLFFCIGCSTGNEQPYEEGDRILRESVSNIDFRAKDKGISPELVIKNACREGPSAYTVREIKGEWVLLESVKGNKIGRWSWGPKHEFSPCPK